MTITYNTCVIATIAQHQSDCSIALFLVCDAYENGCSDCNCKNTSQREKKHFWVACYIFYQLLLKLPLHITCIEAITADVINYEQFSNFNCIPLVQVHVVIVTRPIRLRVGSGYTRLTPYVHTRTIHRHRHTIVYTCSSYLISHIYTNWVTTQEKTILATLYNSISSCILFTVLIN